jgi:hypothetical protein
LDGARTKVVFGISITTLDLLTGYAQARTMST